MEASLQYAVVAFFVADILLLVALGHLWRTAGGRDVKWWLLAHVLLLLAHIAWVPDVQGSPDSALFAAAGACTVAAAVFLMKGTLLHVGRSIPRGWFIAAGVAMLGSMAAAAAGAPNHLAGIPFMYSIAAGYIATGVVILKRSDAEGLGRWLTGVGLIGAGLHVTTYPVGRTSEAFFPWGLFINGWLELVVGVGLIVMHSEAARRRIADQQRELRSLFERATVGIWRASDEGLIVQANPALCSMLDYPDEAALLEARVPLLGQPTDAGVSVATVRGRSGTMLELELATHATPDESGFTEGFARDVTQERKLERQLAVTQKMEAVGQLAGGVAHDFNNLLMVILSAQAVLRESVAPDLAELLDDAQEAADRATALTRQLMALGRPEPANPTTQDLGDLVAALRAVLQRLVDESVKLTIEAEPDVLIEADRSQLEQVILNLVVNARDAVEPHGTITVRVLRTRGESGDLATIEVEDDGSGIAPENRTRLFEPFFTTKQPGRGTGLGLSTVYAVVSQLKGTISVESEVGVGTKFVLHLPVATKRMASPAPAPELEQANLEGVRILLVEDQASLQKVLARVLREAGANVATAADGVEALETKLEDVDIVVSDVVMPRMGGPELIDEVRRLRPHFPALLMTGYADPKSKVQSRDIEVLNKPFPPAALVRAVRQAVAERPCAPDRDEVFARR